MKHMDRMQEMNVTPDHYDANLFGYVDNPYTRNEIAGFEKMQRRANSLPDPTAIAIFSQTQMGQHDLLSDLFSADISSHHVAGVLAQQYNQSTIGMQPHIPPNPVHDAMEFQAARANLQCRALIERLPDNFGNIAIGSCTSTNVPFTSLNPFPPNGRQDALFSSLKDTHVLSDLANQNPQVELSSLLHNIQMSQQNCGPPYSAHSKSLLPHSFEHQEQFYNQDFFDDKSTEIESLPISEALTDDYEIGLLLHEACKKDDLPVIANILQKFPLSGRWSLRGGDATGDVALHIGKC
jgi:hypothetical protein